MTCRIIRINECAECPKAIDEGHATLICGIEVRWCPPTGTPAWCPLEQVADTADTAAILLRTIAAEAERTGSWHVPPDLQERLKWQSGMDRAHQWMSWNMSEDNRMIRERIAALDAENAALREDKARLDALWSLCRQHMYECGIGFFWDEEDGWFIAKVDHGDNGLTLSHGPNVDADIRAALDAARKGGA